MFVARQPIFTTNLEVYGYELLYRDSDNSTSFAGMSSFKATASVLITTLENGINHIVGDKKAFINFDADFIKNFIPEILDEKQMVIEILENVKVDDELIDRIKELREMGYKIALDDFEEDISSYPLVPYSDIIKYDLMITPLDKIKKSVKMASRLNKILLAEKIETEEEFLIAKKMGFNLFQGYFFSKPKIVSKLNTRNNSKSQYIRILNELKKVEPSYQIIAEIIEKDVKLAYRLLRVISSRSGNDLIYSIKRALTYMGLNEIDRWIRIMMIQEIGVKKPKELISISLIRSKFAENVSQLCNRIKDKKYEASMMGLFSTIDVLLDTSMEKALTDTALPISIKNTLIKKEGELYPLYELMIYYERCNWKAVENTAKKFGLNQDEVTNAYLDAVNVNLN
jgi:EAL and modified HD-GYP domain-containing signal transduction protein